MAEKSAPLNQPAVCAVVQAGVPFVGKQGFSYAPGSVRRNGGNIGRRGLPG
jgi:hypothetical protein